MKAEKGRWLGLDGPEIVEQSVERMGHERLRSDRGKREEKERRRHLMREASLRMKLVESNISTGHTLTVTLPHFPLSFVGSECGSPRLVPQYPRRIGSTDSFAMMMAARMAVATSLEVLIPRPIWPSESPITTMALKRVRWPARVCFCTGLICGV